MSDQGTVQQTSSYQADMPRLPNAETNQVANLGHSDRTQVQSIQSRSKDVTVDTKDLALQVIQGLVANGLLLLLHLDCCSCFCKSIDTIGSLDQMHKALQVH
jgi:hypothetical protein